MSQNVDFDRLVEEFRRPIFVRQAVLPADRRGWRVKVPASQTMRVAVPIAQSTTNRRKGTVRHTLRTMAIMRIVMAVRAFRGCVSASRISRNRAATSACSAKHTARFLCRARWAGMPSAKRSQESERFIEVGYNPRLGLGRAARSRLRSGGRAGFLPAVCAPVSLPPISWAR